MTREQIVSAVDRLDAKQRLLSGLQHGLRPNPRNLRWPSRPVVFELFRWLNHHPQIEQWCQGSMENSAETVRFITLVERCFRSKQRKLVRETGQDRDASEPVRTVGTEESRNRVGHSTWTVLVGSLMHGTDAFWPEMSQRRIARECFESHADNLQKRLVALQEVAVLISQLGFDPSGWDLSSAEKFRKEIGQVISIAAQLQQNEKLNRILEELGRLHTIDNECPLAKTSRVFEDVFERRRVRREVLLSGIPFETTGIELSDNVELMLPDEAVLLADAELKILWYSRFAEGQLSTYAVQGTDIAERMENRPESRPKSNERTGPVIALIDTSGSMAGRPEDVAKALILGLCQVAFRLRRKVFVMNFSGIGNIESHELTFDIFGLLKLLEFLKESFGGGTDVNGPLRSALDRITHDRAWASADILIASDGEFSVDIGLLERLQSTVSEDGLRVTGVLIGAKTEPMRTICGEKRLYRFNQWQDVADQRW